MKLTLKEAGFIALIAALASAGAFGVITIFAKVVHWIWE